MKASFASSVHANLQKYDATKFIDGKKDTFFASDGNSEMNPWIQVELKEIGVVDRITIFNRKDCCGERAKNMRVTVGFTKFTKGMNPLDLPKDEICATYKGPGKNGETISIDCKAAMRGQYVSFQLVQDTKAILNLAEIEIYGHSGNIFKHFK